MLAISEHEVPGRRDVDSQTSKKLSRVLTEDDHHESMRNGVGTDKYDVGTDTYDLVLTGLVLTQMVKLCNDQRF